MLPPAFSRSRRASIRRHRGSGKSIPCGCFGTRCDWMPESFGPVAAGCRHPCSRRGDQAGTARRGANPVTCHRLRFPAGLPAAPRSSAAHSGYAEIRQDAGRILLTDSGSQAIELAIQLVVQPGDAVLVDDPCYFNFQAILGFHRVTVIGIPFLNNGPDPTALAAAAARHGPRLYISNATLQNPTGATLTPAVAHKLLKIAERYDFAILEDDTFATRGEPFYPSRGAG